MAVQSALLAKENGNAAFKQGNFELALANFSTAVKLDPSEYTFVLNRSLVYLKLQNWSEAEKDAKKALALMPDHPKCLFRLATAQMNKGDLVAARKNLEAARRHGATEEEIATAFQLLAKLTLQGLGSDSRLLSSEAHVTGSAESPADTGSIKSNATKKDVGRSLEASPVFESSISKDRLKAAIASTSTSPLDPPIRQEPLKGSALRSSRMNGEKNGKEHADAKSEALRPANGATSFLLKEVSSRKFKKSTTENHTGILADQSGKSFSEKKKDRNDRKSRPVTSHGDDKRKTTQQESEKAKDFNEALSRSVSSVQQASSSDDVEIHPAKNSIAGQSPSRPASVTEGRSNSISDSFPKWSAPPTESTLVSASGSISSSNPKVIASLPSSTTTRPRVFVPYVHQDQERQAPKSSLRFETAWNESSSIEYRASLLKSIDPVNLEQLFDSSLTPDILSELVDVLGCRQTADYFKDLRWRIDFMTGLTKVKRFNAVVGFLEEKETVLLRSLIDGMKSNLNGLEKAWGIETMLSQQQ